MCLMKQAPLPIKETDQKEIKIKDEAKKSNNEEIKNNIEKNIEKSDQKPNEDIDIDMDFMKENEGKIVKMQAKIKGNMARKQIKGVQEQKKPKEN